MVATSFAALTDDALLGLHTQDCFRIVTLRTQHKFSNESIKKVLQFYSIMRSIHNVTVILKVKVGLRTQLASKIFSGV